MLCRLSIILNDKKSPSAEQMSVENDSGASINRCKNHIKKYLVPKVNKYNIYNLFTIVISFFVLPSNFLRNLFAGCTDSRRSTQLI